MGICYEAIDMLAFLKQKGMMNHISSVLELGNQHVRYHRIDVIEKLRELKIDIKPNYSTSTFYKQWGIEHYTAIDLNGLEGALKFDLNTLFTKDGLFSKEYDLVTNFGTTEHCFNQATAFENIHNLTKKGGYILHLSPNIKLLSHQLNMDAVELNPFNSSLNQYIVSININFKYYSSNC